MLLDIAPTLAMYEQTSMEFARSYWWWFWLIHFAMDMMQFYAVPGVTH